MFDSCLLTKEMISFPTVKKVYKKIAETKLEYRGLKCGLSEVLKDTIKSYFCIISKGGIAKDEYEAAISAFANLSLNNCFVDFPKTS